jgi:hypothetical protein
MADPRVIEKVLTIFDKDYAWRAIDAAPVYAAARPSPHIHFDGFLHSGLAQEIAAAFPNNSNVGWTVHSHEHADRKFLGDETKVDPLFRAFMQATASRQFLLFLDTLTDIKGLIPDPYYIGGGAMTAGGGDKHVSSNITNQITVMSGDPGTAAAAVGVHLDRTAADVYRNLQGSIA